MVAIAGGIACVALLVKATVQPLPEVGDVGIPEPVAH